MGSIRDEIKAQAEDTLISPGYLWIIPAGAAVLAHKLGYSYNSWVGGGFLLLGIVLFIFVVVLRMLRKAQGITCPVCGAPLDFYAYAMEDGPQHMKIDTCPTCGVNLDDPMPESPAPPTSVGKRVWK